MTQVILKGILLFMLASCAMHDHRVSHYSSKSSNTIKIIEKKQYNSKKLVLDISENESINSIEMKIKVIIDNARSLGGNSLEQVANDIYLKASDFSKKGKVEQSALLYKYLYNKFPQDLYIRKKYAIELIKGGNLQAAAEHLKDIFIKSKESDDAIGLVLAGVYTATKRKKLARNTYLKVLKHSPGNEEACIFLSKSFALEKKYKDADKLLIKCEKINQKGIFSYYRGKIAYDRGNPDLAKKLFRKSYEVDSKYYQGVLAIGLLYEESGKYKKAVKIYREFLKKNPNSYPVLSRMMQIVFSINNIDEVIGYAERLSSIDPSDLNLKVRLGILYTDAKKYDDAKGIFKEILAAVPNSDKVLYYLASLYQQTDELNEAISFFSKIPEESSLFHDGNIQIGQILSQMALVSYDSLDDDISNESNPIKKFVSFVSLKSKKHDALRVELAVMLANFYEQVDRIGDSINSLVSVMDEDGYSDGHEYYLATLYEKNQDTINSRKVIKRLIGKDPDNADALNFLGYSYLEEGVNLSLAYEYISKAVKLKPNDGYIRDSLGWYYYKIGDYRRASKELTLAWSMVKSDYIVTKHLAIVYQKMKEYTKAKKFFKEALANCKIESEKMDIIRNIQELNLHLGPINGPRRLPTSVED